MGSLLEDESHKTRLFMVRTLATIFTNTSLDWDTVVKIYPVLLNRLDDVDGVVRVETVRCVSAVLSSLLSPLEELLPHVEKMLSALMMHMDDQDQAVRAECWTVSRRWQ